MIMRINIFWDMHSSVGRAMGWGLIPSRDKRFFSTQCPHWLWGSSRLLPNGYWGLNARGKAAGGVKLVPKPRMVELYIHSTTHHHGMVFN
jgi:hypothetical protein